MSEMKCPFCQQKLDAGNYYVHCHNPHCNTTVEMEGTEEMWTALIRTRKALVVAVDALREIHLPKQWCPVFAEQEIAKKALDEITALEQKDK